MAAFSRRAFLQDVGCGMLIAGVGFETAVDLGLASARAADDTASDRLTFGSLEPLVCLMQDTPVEKLLPQLAERLKSGTELRELVAAAALANAHTFGGEDYVGFHTIMATCASISHVARIGRLATGAASLQGPVSQYQPNRRSRRRKSEKLHTVEPATDKVTEDSLLDAVRQKQMDEAERRFAAFASRGAEDAFEHLLPIVQDNYEVHRVVLPYRAWDLLDIIGKEHAHTLLRQSIRYCVHNESPSYHEYGEGGRTLLPKLLEQYKLLEPRSATRKADDHWVESLSQAIFSGSPRRPPKQWPRRSPKVLNPTISAKQLASQPISLYYAIRGAPATRCSRANLRGACTAIRLVCTPATRPTPGETWPVRFATASRGMPWHA